MSPRRFLATAGQSFGLSSVGNSRAILFDVHVRLRQVLKALLVIGSQLSQTREYRDMYEDLQSKVSLRSDSVTSLR